MISTAIDPDAASWDRAFGLADRVERVDPGRAGAAPLRTRLNLLAATAGFQLEADLRPHLRGLSACLWGDPRQPGRPIGAVLILHLDGEQSASRLVEKITPGLGAIMTGRATVKAAPRDRPGRDEPARGPRRLGIVLGRQVSVWQVGPDLMIAWGNDDVTAPLWGNVEVARSLASVCDGWAGQGRGSPQRLAAIWPGRLWRAGHEAESESAPIRVLAEDPPILWWGWSDHDHGYDILLWPDLAGRVRRFLNSLPLDVPLVP
jgi:hypothetical protein